MSFFSLQFCILISFVLYTGNTFNTFKIHTPIQVSLNIIGDTQITHSFEQTYTIRAHPLSAMNGWMYTTGHAPCPPQINMLVPHHTLHYILCYNSVIS